MSLGQGLREVLPMTADRRLGRPEASRDISVGPSRHNCLFNRLTLLVPTDCAFDQLPILLPEESELERSRDEGA
jgi:hypothetical protein